MVDITIAIGRRLHLRDHHVADALLLERQTVVSSQVEGRARVRIRLMMTSSLTWFATMLTMSANAICRCCSAASGFFSSFLSAA